MKKNKISSSGGSLGPMTGKVVHKFANLQCGSLDQLALFRSLRVSDQAQHLCPGHKQSQLIVDGMHEFFMRHETSTGLLFHVKKIFAENSRVATLNAQNFRKWKLLLVL